MLRKETLIAVLGSPIAYYPIFARVLGGVEAGLFVSLFFSWYDKRHNPEEWIHITQDEILEETGLTRRNQETARRCLRSLGVLEEQRAAIPARLTYRLNLDVLAALVNEASAAGLPIPHPTLANGEVDYVR